MWRLHLGLLMFMGTTSCIPGNFFGTNKYRTVPPAQEALPETEKDKELQADKSAAESLGQEETTPPPASEATNSQEETTPPVHEASTHLPEDPIKTSPDSVPPATNPEAIDAPVVADALKEVLIRLVPSVTRVGEEVNVEVIANYEDGRSENVTSQALLQGESPTAQEALSFGKSGLLKVLGLPKGTTEVAGDLVPSESIRATFGGKKGHALLLVQNVTIKTLQNIEDRQPMSEESGITRVRYELRGLREQEEPTYQPRVLSRDLRYISSTVVSSRPLVGREGFFSTVIDVMFEVKFVPEKTLYQQQKGSFLLINANAVTTKTILQSFSWLSSRPNADGSLDEGEPKAIFTGSDGHPKASPAQWTQKETP